MKILVLEDNYDNALLIENSLKHYEIFKAARISEAWELLNAEAFDLFLIDVNLPDGSGFDFCSELNLNPSYEATPKIILSGLSETKDKVYGFQCGAEDYMIKPFAIEELRVRVDSKLKKVSKSTAKSRIDSIQFDFQFQKAFFVNHHKEVDLELTPTEFKILHHIMSVKGRLCSRQELVREIWKKNGLYIAQKGIDSHLSHIRKKIKPCSIQIHSIYNRGYLYK